jgi:hypothetical protein
MLTAIALFLLGLVLLALGGDSIVKGASGLAQRLGLTPFTAGLVLVAFATSLPELAVNLVAILHGQGELALGNAVGSNVANVGLTLGAAALAAPIVVRWRALSPLLVIWCWAPSPCSQWVPTVRCRASKAWSCCSRTSRASPSRWRAVGVSPPKCARNCCVCTHQHDAGPERDPLRTRGRAGVDRLDAGGRWRGVNLFGLDLSQSGAAVIGRAWACRRC